jgi:hypothetical protein
MEGYVIGINSAFLSTANNAYYAVKIKYALELIRYSNLRINTPQPNRFLNFSNQNLAQRTSAVKDFVYMIEAY